MNREQARNVAVEILTRVAPNVDAETVDETASLRDDLGLDSMDFLDLLTGIQERTGVEVPEQDYEQVQTIRALADYVVEHAERLD